VIGMVTSTILMSKLVKNKVKLSDPVKNVLVKEFRNVSSTIPLHELGRILARNSYVFVDEKYICSNFDLLNFIKDKMP